MEQTNWNRIRELFDVTMNLVEEAPFCDFSGHLELKVALNELANEMLRGSGVQAQDLTALKGMLLKLLIAVTGVYKCKHQVMLVSNLCKAMEHSWPTIDDIKIMPDDWADSTIRMMEEFCAGRSEVTVRIEKENGRRYQAGTYIRRIR